MRANFAPFCSKLYLWNTKAAIFFSNTVTIPHRHNTLQIVFDLQRGFKCRLAGEKWNSYTSVIIGENMSHQLDTNGSTQLIIYLDAGSVISKEIKSRYLADQQISSAGLAIFSIVNPDELQQSLLNPDVGVFEKLIDQLLQSLAGDNRKIKNDDRITTVKQLINTSDPSDLNTALLAAKVYLSESRLRSRFKEITGISLHTYIIWARIRFAINDLMRGGAVNEAALAAGFTDGSHFHKMMVKMFGISPSQFLKNNRSFTAINCDTVVTNFETTACN